ncbi:MAG: DUF2071 domain-containing protein [Nocardiopsaceae bacterium]|nr:DUF2071 domain-containing protein [Nocardiopsaceae bacterium]
MPPIDPDPGKAAADPHRPWRAAGRPPPAAAPPLPGAPFLTQKWRDVAFLHWPAAPEHVAPLLPEGTWPDVLGGVTYVGVVAFQATATRVAGFLPVGAFNEVNVRLYSVDRQGRQGVVFLSMDADSLHNVLAARLLVRLPYMWSDVSLGRDADGRRGYAVQRRCPMAGAGVRFRIRVGGRIRVPCPAQRFVTARWGLHAHHTGGTRWIRILHQQWELYSADLTSYEGELVDAAGVPIGSAAAPWALWSPGVDTSLRPDRPPDLYSRPHSACHTPRTCPQPGDLG